MHEHMSFSHAASFIVLILLASCAPHRPVAEQEHFFLHEVKPILERNCLRCHAGPSAPAGLDLSSPAVITATSKGRRFISPHQPGQSLMLTAVSRKGTHPTLMPRLDISLTDDQIGVLTEWIEDGAAWPSGSAGSLHHVPSAEKP